MNAVFGQVEVECKKAIVCIWEAMDMVGGEFWLECHRFRVEDVNLGRGCRSWTPSSHLGFVSDAIDARGARYFVNQLCLFHLDLPRPHEQCLERRSKATSVGE